MRAFAVDRYDALVLAERPVAVDPEVAATLLADAWIDAARATTTRGCCGGCGSRGTTSISHALVRTAAYGVRSLDEVRLDARAAAGRPARRRSRRARVAAVPSGRHLRLEYHEDGTVVGVGEAAGGVRSRRDAANRPAPRAGAARAHRAERAAGAAHARSAQLLGSHVPGGEEGTARPLSEAPVAGGSVDGAANGARNAKSADGSALKPAAQRDDERDREMSRHRRPRRRTVRDDRHRARDVVDEDHHSAHQEPGPGTSRRAISPIASPGSSNRARRHRPATRHRAAVKGSQRSSGLVGFGDPAQVVLGNDEVVGGIGRRIGVAESAEDLLRAIGKHRRRLVERHAAGNGCARGERGDRHERRARRTQPPRRRARPRSPRFRRQPRACPVTAFRRRPARPPADRRRAMRRRSSSADAGRCAGSFDRQRRMTRSIAGSRSRTIDDGVVTVPVSCSCFRSPSVFAS